MAKIAVITDSNSGMQPEEAAREGIVILPMPFHMEEQVYFENLTLSQDAFYEKQQAGVDISTSQPSPADVCDLWRSLLKEYDEIVHIPMSSGLSGSCGTAQMLSTDEEFAGRVFVVNNQRISVTQKQSAVDAVNLVKKGYSGSEIKAILEREGLKSGIYICVDTLTYLKKGGRITKTAAAIGTVLQIKPVLQIQGGKLDAYSKCRGMKQARKIMLDALKKDFENRVPGGVYGHRAQLAIAHTKNDEEAASLKEELMQLYPGYEVVVDPLSLSVACHIGPGSLAVAWSQKVEELD